MNPLTRTGLRTETSQAKNKLRMIDQAELNDLVRDLHSTKTVSELLAYRLKRLMVEDARITIFRNRSRQLGTFFTKQIDFCYCNNIPGPFAELEQTYDADE